MLKAASANHKVQDLLARSNKILQYDITDYCFNGPDHVLNKTEICQPALFIAGLAAVHLIEEQSGPPHLCNAAAGLSLGEYTALVYTKALSFEEGLKLVKLRGEAMQKASEAIPSAMCSVVGCDDSTLEKLISDVLSTTKGKLQIANYLGPLHRALSGDTASIARVEELARPKYKARLAKRIPVSGAFHSEFMLPAMEQLQKAISQVQMYKPTIPVISNVDGRPHDDPDILKSLLLKQLVLPVLWEDSMKYLLQNGYTGFYEMGTGTTLSNLLKGIVSSSPPVDSVEIVTVSV